jgi:uncharacterized cupredoxin-like copper-binding protein
MAVGLKPAALAACVLVGLAACGGSDEEPTPAASASETLEIIETEYRLEPSELTIDAAGTYTFRAVNRGEVEHALEVEGNGIEEETETIGPGESAELTVELKAGEYELYCPVGNHEDQGMKGSISVAGGESAGY